MDNYKIKVNDEAESKEAQELFEELGYKIEVFVPAGFPRWVATTDSGEDYWYSTGFDFIAGLSKFKELNLPQLRDLVVLKRNDVRDATHRDKQDESIYLTSDKVIYYWQGEWCKSAINKSNDYENYIANSLTPIAKPQAPALISGADAFTYLIGGSNDVQTKLNDTEKWRDVPTGMSWAAFANPDRKFRLKPQTIKVELELPKPFEPKEDCHVYILDDGKTDGYRRYSYEVHGDKGNTFIGIWRTEEEIKQVVEQLRKIRGTNS